MTESWYANCTTDCERMPECTVCHRTKKPWGRDAPLGSGYCNPECGGYATEPIPGHLWRGELARIRGEDGRDER